MRFGLESVQGAGPTVLRAEQIFAAPTERAAELGGVGALVLAPPRGDPRPYVVRPFRGLPRLLLVPEAIVVPSRVAVAAILDRRVDPRRTAVLENGENGGEGEGFEGQPLVPSAGSPAFSGRVVLTESRSGFVAASAECGREAILVLFDTFERGWTATVDGSPASVLRADGAFLGLRLSPGRHAVRFQYSLPWLREGFGFLIVGAFGLVLAVRRLPRESPEES